MTEPETKTTTPEAPPVDPSRTAWFDVSMDKELRRDLDQRLQTLKSLAPSRERALAITKLQEAIMWLGMDLKRLGDTIGTQPVDPTARARAAYARYGEVTGFKNFRGEPMPAWDHLGETIQKAWIAAAGPGGPYPSSYDPSSPRIEPTADGLKL